MASTRDIFVTLADSEPEPSKANAEQQERIKRIIDNLSDKFEMEEGAALMMSAKYYHQPESAELQPLLSPSAEMSDNDATFSFDYYQRSLDLTLTSQDESAAFDDLNDEQIERIGYRALK
jgi:hypothetical protein